MDLADAISDYLADCYARNLSHQTISWYTQKLHAWTKASPKGGAVADLTAARVRAYLGGLAVGDQTRHGYTQVVKGFLVWCEEEKLLSRGVAARIKLPKVEKTVIKTLSRDQVRRLHLAVDRQVYRRLVLRDHAILDVLLGTGLRASELCSLTVGRTFVQNPADCYLLLKGKGKKEREVGLPPDACKRLRRWLRERPSVPYEEVFVGRGRPLAVSGVDQLLYRLERRAGDEHFTGIRVSAHTFRHTFAVTYLSEGGDVYKLSKLMGHTSVSTTERYLRDYMQRGARQGGPNVLSAFA
jgi:integrase/recombinase XerD